MSGFGGEGEIEPLCAKFQNECKLGVVEDSEAAVGDGGKHACRFLPSKGHDLSSKCPSRVFHLRWGKEEGIRLVCCARTVAQTLANHGAELGQRLGGRPPGQRKEEIAILVHHRQQAVGGVSSLGRLWWCVGRSEWLACTNKNQGPTNLIEGDLGNLNVVGDGLGCQRLSRLHVKHQDGLFVSVH